MPTVLAAPSTVVKVPMAGIGYGENADELETLLGSCVGVAIWDRATGKGALAHVVLPDSRGQRELPGKYADTAIAEIHRQLLRQGANPLALTAKIAGGATMFGVRRENDVGELNCRAVVEHLQQHKIKLLSQHTAGDKGRIIRFTPRDGAMSIYICRELVAEI